MVRLILPYAVWMVLMMALPSTAVGYAIRTLATALALGWSLGGHWRQTVGKMSGAALGWGVLVGVLVCVVWVVPESFGWYRRLFILGDEAPTAASAFDPKTCGWALTVVKLLGSALVISVAEELFFRKWLIGFAGFWWMVGLFAIEHDRWLVGAIAGVAYGYLYLRKGLGSAIIAHAVTNLLLGLWVIYRGEWAFW